jgi:hypothetical protein
VDSINDPGGNRCVDVFAREDGTFGFEEYRRDPEDPRGWVSVGLYSNLAWSSAEEARRQARSAIAWLAQGGA